MSNRPMARLPQSPVLDKENASNRCAKEKSQSETKKPFIPKTPLRKTPRRQPFQAASAASPAITPPGSKVLRQHFAQLSVTPQRTKIQSGAVRLQPQSKKKTHPPRSPSRIGYDGTTKTPSKELLRSTACTRAHQVPHHHHSIASPWKQKGVSPICDLSVMSVDLQRYTAGRDGCCDPVALILLNDAKEDLGTLVEQDISPQAIQKVSSSLSDVMDDDEVATLVRPVPRVMRPKS